MAASILQIDSRKFPVTHIWPKKRLIASFFNDALADGRELVFGIKHNDASFYTLNLETFKHRAECVLSIDDDRIVRFSAYLMSATSKPKRSNGSLTLKLSGPVKLSMVSGQ